MSQKPTGAEAAARVAQGRAIYAAVHQLLAENQQRAGHEPKRFFVTFAQRYRTNSHPVLGQIDPDEVLGLRADNLSVAKSWAQHWLGMRGFADVLTELEFEAAQATQPPTFSGGCPRVWDVPPARYYRHPQGSRIIVWQVPHGQAENGYVFELDAYKADGTRKQTSATAQALEEGHGAWNEVFQSFDGEELTKAQVLEICEKAGVF